MHNNYCYIITVVTMVMMIIIIILLLLGRIVPSIAAYCYTHSRVVGRSLKSVGHVRERCKSS